MTRCPWTALSLVRSEASSSATACSRPWTSEINERLLELRQAACGSVFDDVTSGVTAELAPKFPKQLGRFQLVEALGRVKIASPIVLRLDGTNAEEGRRILASHLSDTLIMEPTMLDAARRAVALAGGKK